MSALTSVRDRFSRRRWLVVAALLAVAVAGLVIWQVRAQRPTSPDPSRTFRDLETILAEYRENGWNIAVSHAIDRPFRTSEDCGPMATRVGSNTRLVYRNELGEGDVAITSEIDRAHLVLPLETANGQLTYVILEKVVRSDYPDRKR